MRRVAQRAGIELDDVDYFEAHATGTTVGDATEGNAIARAYGSSTRQEPLRLASLRSNVGHMEAASFASSLLKVLRMMERRHFAPISRNHRALNPNIPWTEGKLRVQTTTEPFPERARPVLVGINSFGFGGSNGHCMIEEYRAPRTFISGVVDRFQAAFWPVPLSAKSDDALVEAARRLAAYLGNEGANADMPTLVGNLWLRRTLHRVRATFAASTIVELRSKLEDFVERAEVERAKAKGLSEKDVAHLQLRHITAQAPEGATGPFMPPKVLMVFPGQGMRLTSRAAPALSRCQSPRAPVARSPTLAPTVWCGDSPLSALGTATCRLSMGGVRQAALRDRASLPSRCRRHRCHMDRVHWRGSERRCVRCRSGPNAPRDRMGAARHLSPAGRSVRAPAGLWHTR